MNKQVNSIMLIDDNPDDNFFHERVIRRSNVAKAVVIQESAVDALQYLKAKGEHHQPHPDLIFLDINMPEMSGWEFLKEYEKLEKNVRKGLVIVMLTTSNNPDDIASGQAQNSLFGFRTKPLTKQMLGEIMDQYWSTKD
jgi:CheY-like chemotaxis protein